MLPLSQSANFNRLKTMQTTRTIILCCPNAFKKRANTFKYSQIIQKNNKNLSIQRQVFFLEYCHIKATKPRMSPLTSKQPHARLSPLTRSRCMAHAHPLDVADPCTSEPPRARLSPLTRTRFAATLVFSGHFISPCVFFCFIYLHHILYLRASEHTQIDTIAVDGFFFGFIYDSLSGACKGILSPIISASCELLRHLVS